MMRFFVHCAGRSDASRLNATGRGAAGAEARGVMRSEMVSRAILSAAGWRLTAEALDRVRFVLVGLEDGQELGDRQQVLDALGEVQQLELPALTAHGGVGP